MQTRKFALIGYPLGHTMSPFIHERLFKLSNRSFTYEVLEITPDELLSRTDLLSDYDGLNVTIPHKRSIIQMLSEIEDKAALYGAVNTISCKNKKGYNTDAQGFLNALKSSNINLSGRVVLCGCGGVARMMAYESVIKGATLTVAVRESDIPSANELAREILIAFPKAIIDVCDINEITGDISLLINATPLGMYPNIDQMPVGASVLKQTTAVFDAVYNPQITKLLSEADSAGAVISGGMPMLVHQAVVAHEIWDNDYYSAEDINQLIKDANEYMLKHFQ